MKKDHDRIIDKVFFVKMDDCFSSTYDDDGILQRYSCAAWERIIEPEDQ